MIKLLFALIAISGYIANINDKKKLSYWLWLLSNAGWAIISIYNYEYSMALMFLSYEAFCFYGIIKIMNKTNG